MAADYPLTGTGLGTFEFVFPAYQDHQVDLLVDYAHNDWVQLLAETGWVGLILFGGGLAWLFVAGTARWFKGRDPFRLGIGLGALGALLVMAVHELTEFNLHLPANALLLTLIVALLQQVLFDRGRDGDGTDRQPGTEGPVQPLDGLPVRLADHPRRRDPGLAYPPGLAGRLPGPNGLELDHPFSKPLRVGTCRRPGPWRPAMPPTGCGWPPEPIPTGVVGPRIGKFRERLPG